MQSFWMWSELCSCIHITGGLLHWFFVWRLRRHEGGLGWPCRNKEQIALLHEAPWGEGRSKRGRLGLLTAPMFEGGAVRTRQDGGWSPMGRTTQRRGVTSRVHSNPPTPSNPPSCDQYAEWPAATVIKTQSRLWLTGGSRRRERQRETKKAQKPFLWASTTWSSYHSVHVKTGNGRRSEEGISKTLPQTAMLQHWHKNGRGTVPRQTKATVLAWRSDLLTQNCSIKTNKNIALYTAAAYANTPGFFKPTNSQ